MSAAHSRSPDHLSPADPVAGHRRFLHVVFTLAAGWSLSLLLMDVWTAKPNVVSPGQILNAHVVVVARRVRADGDRIKVERVLRGDLEPDRELRVLNLADVANVSADRPYLFALSRFRHDFEVTTLDGQRVAPLVYPASPDAIEQAKSILR
jgi:hypothetical protein